MSKNLRHAIKLREWTRRACDINDMPSIRYLNKKADAAYLKLDPSDASLYLVWCAESMRALHDNAQFKLNTLNGM